MRRYDDDTLSPRHLRRHQTPAEEALWDLLRDRRLGGLKFRRQFRIDGYIADFYCHDRKLVVELDGMVHEELRQIEKDRNRDAYLRSIGLLVVRIPNRDVFEDPAAVLRLISAAARRALTPDPSPVLPPGPPGEGSDA